MTPVFGDDLPRPSPGELTIYLLGPGIGESVVAIMPDGRSVVMDVCSTIDGNLTTALLDAVGVATIDLLVVSHPDLDHVKGLAELIVRRPREVWRYPLEASARDFVLDWARRAGKSDVAAALDALASYARTADADTFSVSLGDQMWPRDGTSAFRVHALAPTEYDKERAARAWNRRLLQDPVALRTWLGEVVAGTRRIGDAPNVISLAICIEVGGHRILLGGDVLAGTASPKSGWKGVRRLLERHGRAHLITDLCAVKVPHHGSKGAHDSSVWALHASGARRPVAMIAPFSSTPLPDVPTLLALRGGARSLLVSSHDAALDARAQAAGWTQSLATSGATNVPVVSITVSAARGVTSFVAPSAVEFRN